MKSGGLTLSNAIAICEMSKISWQTGKLRMKDDLENHSKGQKYLLEHWLNINRFQREINQDFIDWQESITRKCFLAMSWKGDDFDSRSGRFGKLDASNNLSSKN